MDKKIDKLIDETMQILNDEALFHKRDIPGDQDEFEPRRSSHFDTGKSRYEMFSAIEMMIEIYDHLDESRITPEIAAAAMNVKKSIRELARCAGKV